MKMDDEYFRDPPLIWNKMLASSGNLGVEEGSPTLSLIEPETPHTLPFTSTQKTPKFSYNRPTFLSINKFKAMASHVATTPMPNSITEEADTPKSYRNFSRRQLYDRRQRQSQR